MAQPKRFSETRFSAMHVLHDVENPVFNFRKWWASVMFHWRTGFQTLDTSWARIQAYFDLYWVDHGFLRAIYGNEFDLAPGVIRRAQPSPKDIRAFAAKGGKTIINLRGEGRGGPYLLEREACAAAGVALVNVRTSSRDLPMADVVQHLADLFGSAERPIMFHCKSGADRAGFVAALYVLFQGGSVEKAMAELDWRYLHFKASPTGVLDQMFVAFAASGSSNFREWIATDYHPEQIARDFHASRVGAVIVDRILRRE